MEQCKMLPVHYLVQSIYPDLYPVHALSDKVGKIFTLHIVVVTVLFKIIQNTTLHIAEYFSNELMEISVFFKLLTNFYTGFVSGALIVPLSL